MAGTQTREIQASGAERWPTAKNEHKQGSTQHHSPQGKADPEGTLAKQDLAVGTTEQGMAA